MSNVALDYLRAQEWSMGNGQCPDCHGMGPMMQSFYPHRTEIHGHDTDCKLSAAIAALSHAAGQDGEQCRAASGYAGRLASKLEDVREGIADVLPIVYLETIDDAIEALRALSRGVPEGST